MSERISIRIPNRLKRDIADKARAERKTVSDYVRSVLEDQIPSMTMSQVGVAVRRGSRS